MITIITRTFNNGGFIKKAIESASNQDFEDYEIVVVNDGSTDNTKNIIESFKDNKLRIINQENKGMIESGYIGLENAKGEYVIFLDGDDELKENALSELFNALKGRGYGFAYCDYYEIDLRKGVEKIVSLNNIFNSLACGILYKKKVIDEIGFWDRNFILPEYDLLIRLMKKHKGVHVKKPLYVYNRHGKSMTADKKKVELAKKQLFEKYGKIEGFKEY